MAEYTFIKSYLTVFKEIFSNLEAMEIKYDDEDLALILLCSLPTSYSTFRDTILYSWDTLTLDKVYDTLFSKKKLISNYWGLLRITGKIC